MKRFTEALKWSDPWFRKLSPPAKLLWLYVLDNCDQSGVIDLDIELASFQIGQPIETNHVAEIQSRLETLPDGKLWISKFIGFQYPGLSENCKPHMPVFQCLAKHNIPVHRVNVLQTHSEGNEKVLNTLPKGNGSVQETDKEKEKKEGGVGETTDRPVELPPAFPKTADDAILLAGNGCFTPEFITDTWNKAVSRGGTDAKNIPIRSWPHYLAIESKYDRGRIEKEKNGNKSQNYRGNTPQRVDRSIGTANEGTAHLYKGLGRVVKSPNVQ